MASTTLPAINVGGKVTQQVMRQIPSPPVKGSQVGSSGMRLIGMQRVDLRSRNGGTFSKSMQQQEQNNEASFEKIDTARYCYLPGMGQGTEILLEIFIKIFVSVSHI